MSVSKVMLKSGDWSALITHPMEQISRARVFSSVDWAGLFKIPAEEILW